MREILTLKSVILVVNYIVLYNLDGNGAQWKQTYSAFQHSAGNYDLC